MFRSPRSAEGHTFRELMRGVPAEPAHYELETECFKTDEFSVDGRQEYRLGVVLTNRDGKARTYAVWVFRDGVERDRLPQPWQDRDETLDFSTFLAWVDDYPDRCPQHEVLIYQNAAGVP